MYLKLFVTQYKAREHYREKVLPINSHFQDYLWFWLIAAMDSKHYQIALHFSAQQSRKILLTALTDFVFEKADTKECFQLDSFSAKTKITCTGN